MAWPSHRPPARATHIVGQTGRAVLARRSTALCGTVALCHCRAVSDSAVVPMSRPRHDTKINIKGKRLI